MDFEQNIGSAQSAEEFRSARHNLLENLKSSIGNYARASFDLKNDATPLESWLPDQRGRLYNCVLKILRNPIPNEEDLKTIEITQRGGKEIPISKEGYTGFQRIAARVWETLLVTEDDFSAPPRYFKDAADLGQWYELAFSSDSPNELGEQLQLLTADELRGLEQVIRRTITISKELKDTGSRDGYAQQVYAHVGVMAGLIRKEMIKLAKLKTPPDEPPERWEYPIPSEEPEHLEPIPLLVTQEKFDEGIKLVNIGVSLIDQERQIEENPSQLRRTNVVWGGRILFRLGSQERDEAYKKIFTFLSLDTKAGAGITWQQLDWLRKNLVYLRRALLDSQFKVGTEPAIFGTARRLDPIYESLVIDPSGDQTRAILSRMPKSELRELFGCADAVLATKIAKFFGSREIFDEYKQIAQVVRSSLIDRLPLYKWNESYLY